MVISNRYYRYTNKESHGGPLLLPGNPIIKLLPFYQSGENVLWTFGMVAQYAVLQAPPLLPAFQSYVQHLGIVKLGWIDNKSILQNTMSIQDKLPLLALWWKL